MYCLCSTNKNCSKTGKFLHSALDHDLETTVKPPEAGLDIVPCILTIKVSLRTALHSLHFLIQSSHSLLGHYLCLLKR